MPDSKNTPRKPKLVRDSFTIPKAEYAAIEALKSRAIAMGTSVKKSELLRAGLMALMAMSDAGFKAAVAAVPTLKPGRPHAEVAPAAKPRPASKATPAKTPAKAPAAKTAVKAAAKKAPAKKAVAKKAPARKAPVKPTAATQAPIPKAPARKAAAKKAPAKPAVTAAPASAQPE
ncbi:hypothetical protein [uncultured Hydrogenophaga sp.]|uniref:hypothetical protein n=1 Tax=uncultured Hydrogenophaga sp. TaxID=199683 RepID=UPI002D1E346B|nr:hypothetical protein [uncultured Hydrogenophaga sp.]